MNKVSPVNIHKSLWFNFNKRHMLSSVCPGVCNTFNEIPPKFMFSLSFFVIKLIFLVSVGYSPIIISAFVSHKS